MELRKLNELPAEFRSVASTANATAIKVGSPLLFEEDWTEKFMLLASCSGDPT